MTRTMLTWRPVTVVLGALLLVGCSSETPTGNAGAGAGDQAAASQPAAPLPEQELLEDLVLANRILTREVGILDIQAHVSARSKTNPNHWYMARFVAPGGATLSDMVEYDLESVPVNGPRNDSAREIYLHGQIFKARPDVMAVVHAHSPEFVAFGATSVPLYWGPNKPVPVWDIRPLNGGRNGIVSSNLLGQSMAEKMGGNEAVLLWGHGISLAARSLPEVIHRVTALRENARSQMAAVSIGSSAQPEAIVDDEAADKKAWDHYRRVDLLAENGQVPTNPAPMPTKPADPVGAARHDLVLANRILSDESVGILGTAGHVSIRHPSNPNSYFVATAAPGSVTDKDIIERDITKPSPDTMGLSIDDEIYKANPDVKAVLYAQPPEIVALSRGVPLRPIVNGAAFIGDGLAVFNLSTLDPKQPLLSNPALGQGVAAALGKKAGVLLSGHGVVMARPSIYNLTGNAYQLRQNARIQLQAMGLKGRVTYLNEVLAAPAPPAEAAANAGGGPQGGGGGGGGQQLGPPEGRDWVYWAQTIPVR
ncbi:MAG: class II aldolase/adducin family protein [Acidobacteria bacterium]|nr:class II aldolase/adducin family protein [Acidobacteriota bacterium]